MRKKVEIKGLFMDFQDQMKSDLALTRKNVPHPGSKGDGCEEAWLKWLCCYLPKRYKADKAFVVDHEGYISDQLDLVIYDAQYTPFVFNHNNTIYVPAESVYAVFEVRQELTKKNLKYAGDKLASIRRLKRTSANIVHAGGEINKPKEPFKIIGGILTTKSGWTPPLGDAFEKTIKDLQGEKFIDIGCSICDGAFKAVEENGEVLITRSSSDEILVFFFLHLFLELQKKGTVPAMNVLEYAKVLNSF